MTSQNDIGALHYEKNDTPTPASIGAIHKAPLAYLSHVLLKPARGIQLNRTHPLARGLVGCWLMNEGTGNIVADLSGNGLDGAFNGNITWSPGIHGSCINFDGTSYVGISGINKTFPLTFSAWANTNDNSTAAMIFYLGDGNASSIADAFFLHMQSNGTFRIIGQTGILPGGGASSTTTANNKQWYHVVGVLESASDVKIYINSRLEDTGTTETPAAGKNVWQIGNVDPDSGGSGTYWDGLLDNISVWERALNSFEIQQLYINPFCMFEGGISPANLFTETAGENYGAAMYHHLQQLGVYS